MNSTPSPSLELAPDPDPKPRPHSQARPQTQHQVDLGGVHNLQSLGLDLTTFCPEGVGCLQNNTENSLDIFHCERQTQGSNFKITTRGIVLSTASSVDPT